MCRAIRRCNLDLTTEEIQTVAGGVLQVEVLEKTRSPVSDGLRFYTKIKATVTLNAIRDCTAKKLGPDDRHGEAEGIHAAIW